MPIKIANAAPGVKLAFSKTERLAAEERFKKLSPEERKKAIGEVSLRTGRAIGHGAWGGPIATILYQHGAKKTHEKALATGALNKHLAKKFLKHENLQGGK